MIRSSTHWLLQQAFPAGSATAADDEQHGALMLSLRAMSHSVSSDVLKAMRESYALTRELGLPNMTSEYWSNLLESGRQDYGGKGDFIADDELWASFRSNVITKGLDNANVPEEALERVQVKWRNIHRELTSVVPERLQHYFEEDARRWTEKRQPRRNSHDAVLSRVHLHAQPS